MKADFRPESILQVRQDTLNAILASCYEILKTLQNGSVCMVSVDFANELQPRKICRYIVLGSYIDWLSRSSLYPQRLQETEYKRSIQGIQANIGSLEVETFPQNPELPPLTSHTFCASAVNLKERVDKIIRDMSSPVLESHLRHMAVQAGKEKK